MPTARRKKPAQPSKDGRVITPGGPRDRSKVHLVQPGQHVSGAGGRLRIVDTATGKVVKDLGDMPDGSGGPRKAARAKPVARTQR